MRICAFILVTLSSLFLLGCEKQNDAEVRRFTQMQTEETVQKELQVQNDRVREMEKSLKTRYEQYEDFSGTFEGAVRNGGSTPIYRVKAVITINHPLYKGDRVRTPSEVEEDLKTLGLDIQILVYDPRYPSSAVGCRFEGVEPDSETHDKLIIREGCSNAFKLSFNRGKLEGILYPSTSPEEMPFVAERRAQ